MIGFLINMPLSAVNWVLYASDPNPWSLFAGIFCGAMAAFCLVLDLAS